jgi:hypothetical protein
VRRLAVASLLAALIAAAPATADESPVVGAGEMVAGHDLAHWLTGWDRWAFGFTQSQVTRGNDCLPQDGGAPVRFLAVRTRAEHVYEVHCTVAASQYLMLAQPGTLCPTYLRPRDLPATPDGLRRCARRAWKEIADPHPRLVLDGDPVTPGPTIETGVFQLRLPRRDNQLFRPGMTRVRVAAVARATILRPLGPGEHTLILGVRYRGQHNLVLVYKLTVV